MAINSAQHKGRRQDPRGQSPPQRSALCGVLERPGVGVQAPLKAGSRESLRSPLSESLTRRRSGLRDIRAASEGGLSYLLKRGFHLNHTLRRLRPLPQFSFRSLAAGLPSGPGCGLSVTLPLCPAKTGIFPCAAPGSSWPERNLCKTWDAQWGECHVSALSEVGSLPLAPQGVDTGLGSGAAGHL